jgi:magnesium chelatase family protein
MFYSVNSMGLLGLSAYPVLAEVDLSQSMPAFEIVGLPGAAVKESRDRVRSAIRNCGMAFPVGKIIVNLSPADVKKDGALYDLPIFLGVLKAAGMLDADLSGSAFFGELSLSGEVRRVNGALPLVLGAKEQGMRRVFLPQANAAEGALVQGIEVYGLSHVKELLNWYYKGTALVPAKNEGPDRREAPPYLDFADVKGQSGAKRALEVAAAGGHNLLMIGSPGAGKSMLAKRIPSILPEMTFQESIETTKIHSVAGTLPEGGALITQRPFRAPHHTISPAGLSGGGSVPRPGEISLAHNGVLFLDELPEFSRDAMEVLRQPIEDGQVTISRVSGTLTYPCSMMVVAAMNPCPCGYFGHPVRECGCSPQAVSRYLSRVSGPLLDRLDLHVEVAPVQYQNLTSPQPEESSESIRRRVNGARKIQQERYQNIGISCNAKLPSPAVNQFCPLDDGASALLSRAFETMGLSARAYDRILKVSRTIADLDGTEVIQRRHIAEAVQYRSLDRKYWSR